MAQDRAAPVAPGSDAEGRGDAARRPEPSVPHLPHRPVEPEVGTGPDSVTGPDSATEPASGTDSNGTTGPESATEPASADSDGAADGGLPRYYRRIRRMAAPGADPTPSLAPALKLEVPAVEPVVPEAEAQRTVTPPVLRLDDLAGLTRAGERRRRRVRLRTVLASIVAVITLLVVGGLAAVELMSRRVLDDVERIPDVFSPINAAARPDKPVGTEKTLNFLLVGVDTHGREQARRTTQSADSIMLMHVTADRRAASFVFLPRDSWVTVPGHGPGRISSAYASGGPSLLVRTVEQLTALRIDHFGIVDFAGFEDITDAVGGLDLRSGRGSAGLPAGTSHLDGGGALGYLRQPGNAMDRVRRQQVVMKAMMAKAGSMGLLSDPRKTFSLLDSVARTVSVDDSLDDGKMRSLVLSLRHLKPGSVTFLTAPIGSVVSQRGQSVVRLDSVRARSLWRAVGKDDVADYVRRYPDDVVGRTAE